MEYLMVPKREPGKTSPTVETDVRAPTAESTAAPSSSLVRMEHSGSRALTSSSPSMDRPLQAHRRHKRTRAEELLVKIRVGDSMLVAKVEDISVGGLFARTQKVIPLGAFVELALLRPGHDELSLTGVIVDDSSKRSGLAVKFEGLSGLANAELRRTVLDQQVKHANGDPDADVAPAKAMRPAAELTGRDRELDELRRKVALLSAENERLRAEVAMAEGAQKLVGRLQVENERLKTTRGPAAAGAVDPLVLADIRRDADAAWQAIARLADNVDKIK